MQIIHWLFKGSNTRSRSRKEQCTVVEGGGEQEQVKSRDLVLYGKRDDEVEAKSTFTILPRREDSRACFYSTLQLIRLDSLGYVNWQQQNTWQSTTQSRGLVGMRHKAEAATVGCKVLRICDIATLGNVSGGCGEGLEEEVQNRRRAASRMKELLKWAAAAKSSKGGRGSKRWKVLGDSRKSSFRWDVGSCSTSSVFSPMSVPLPSRSDQMGSNKISRKSTTLHTADSNTSSLGSPKSKGGQWITTDSDFVVLEL